MFVCLYVCMFLCFVSICLYVSMSLVFYVYMFTSAREALGRFQMAAGACGNGRPDHPTPTDHPDGPSLRLGLLTTISDPGRLSHRGDANTPYRSAVKLGFNIRSLKSRECLGPEMCGFLDDCY